MQRKRPGLSKRGRYWHISISHCGRAVRKSLDTEDEEQAAQLYDKIRAELWEQKHLNKKPERYWEEAALLYVEDFEQKVQDGERKASSLDHYRLTWLNGELKGTPLSAITKEKVTTLLKDQRSKRHYSAIVSAVLRVAESAGYIAAAPRVRIGKASKARKRWLTHDEAGSLLSRTGHLTDAVIFSLATGLRQNNVFTLRWSWIKDRTVSIPAEDFKQGREHTIPLNRTAMECIRRQIGKHSDYVFTNDRRERLTKANFKHHWYAAKRAAGIEDFRWHDLRHTWASWLKREGVAEEWIEQLGGWLSGKMVRRYAHVDVDSLRPYAEVLDEIFSHKIRTEMQPIAAVK